VLSDIRHLCEYILILKCDSYADMMKNIELLFCLYANEWDDPIQCNSNHSRLMGFFAALPPIWRTLQCIRRYYDTKNVFPHLVNCGKYTMSILAAVFLSMYRIDDTDANLSFFITFAAINAVYCCEPSPSSQFLSLANEK